MTDSLNTTEVYLLVQLLEAELQLLSSVGIGDVRGDAGRRLFVPRQVLLGARDGQVGGAPLVVHQAVALTRVSRGEYVVGLQPPVQQVLGRHLGRGGDVLGGRGGRLGGGLRDWTGRAGPADLD